MKKFILVFLTIGFFITQITAQKNYNKALETTLGVKLYKEKPPLDLHVAYIWKLKDKQFYKITLFSSYWEEENTEFVIVNGLNIILIDGFMEDDFQIGAAIQGNYKLKKTDEILIYGGWILSYDYHYNLFIPLTSASFPEYTQKNRLSSGGVIGVNWSFRDDFYLNVEMPIYVGDIAFEHLRIDNPILSEEEKTTTNFNFDLGIRPMAKIGVGTYF